MDSEKEITIKMKAWQVPYLLGAARLGIRTEAWAGALIQTSNGLYDSDSFRWISKIEFLIKKVKSQSGIGEEEIENATDKVLMEIDELVDMQCQENIKDVEKREQEYYEQEIRKKG